MSDGPYRKQEFLDGANHQFAQISAEFEKAATALKDPERRKDLPSSYFDILQKGLFKAQEGGVASYQEKVASRENTDRPDNPQAPEASGTPESTAATHPESEPKQAGTPATS
ncbi:MAG: hypothetical protein M3Y44_11815 [Actinomycetota bacterium]|nr:hypothetical protein [Actinomycetota bacterium]